MFYVYVIGLPCLYVSIHKVQRDSDPHHTFFKLFHSVSLFTVSSFSVMSVSADKTREHAQATTRDTREREETVRSNMSERQEVNQAATKNTIRKTRTSRNL